VRPDGFELRPRPTATEATAVEVAFRRTELAGVLRPDPYASAWRTASLRESAGYEGESDLSAEPGWP
jgi:hypothetical protein